MSVVEFAWWIYGVVIELFISLSSVFKNNFKKLKNILILDGGYYQWKATISVSWTHQWELRWASEDFDWAFETGATIGR